MVEYIAMTVKGFEVEVSANVRVGDTVAVKLIDGDVTDVVESIRAIDHSKYIAREDR